MITFFGCILLCMAVGYALSRRSYDPSGEDVLAGALLGIIVGGIAWGIVGKSLLDYEYRSRGSEEIIAVEAEGSGRQAYLREDLSSGTPYFFLYLRDETGIRAMRIPADDRTTIREVPGADASIETLCRESVNPNAWLWGLTDRETCRYVVTTPAPIALTDTR